MVTVQYQLPYIYTASQPTGYGFQGCENESLFFIGGGPKESKNRASNNRSIKQFLLLPPRVGGNNAALTHRVRGIMDAVLNH